MRNKFDQQLEMLDNSLIEMGSMCESAISMAADALFENDLSIGRSVRALESEIYQKEHEIESLCLKLLLRQQPVAKDLRQISATLKIITDMKRIGNQAADIADIVRNLQGFDCAKYEKINGMATTVSKMLTGSINAYLDKNPKKAQLVRACDDVVDKLFFELKKEFIALIVACPEQGEFALELLMVCKYFEKIGDHAENIAGWVEFSVTGEHAGQM